LTDPPPAHQTEIVAAAIRVALLMAERLGGWPRQLALERIGEHARDAIGSADDDAERARVRALIHSAALEAGLSREELLTVLPPLH
jgi:hypothetical protein